MDTPTNLADKNGKKFKFKKLQRLIQAISHMPMADQHDLLEESFVSWRGGLEQDG